MLARLQGLTTEWLLPMAPGLLLLFTAGWAGNFQAPLSDRAPWLGFLALAAVAALAHGRWWDPLGLGRWAWCLPGIGLSLLISLWASPVPRAGRLAIAALPLIYLLPSAVRRCWSSEVRRRRGLVAVAWVVLAVAGWALWGATRTAMDANGLPWRQALAEARPALPLGHHNLLALWLVALLPVGAAVFFLPGRGVVLRRGLAMVATLVGLWALVATRSLAAAAALATVVAVLGVLRWGWRGALRAFALVVVLLAWQSPRIEQIALGEDSSTLARQAYWQAGLDGVSERLGFGWGPGSTPWVVARHVEPVPGIHPPHDVVADLHSLPLQLAYELGVPVALAVFLLLAVAIWRALGRARRSGDPVAWAGALGLLGAMVASLGGLPLSVLALPIVLGVVAGMVDPGASAEVSTAVADGEQEESESPRPRVRTERAPFGIALAMGLLALAPGLAQHDYDSAAEVASWEPEKPGATTDPVVAQELRNAIALDPGFPLYRARLAWLEVETNPGDLETRRWNARRAHQAAEDAFAVAPLWLAAGTLGQEARERWSRDALLHACELDPLAPMAPFRLATGGRREPLVEVWAARALLAEPRLLAAEYWVANPALLRSAVDRILATEGVDPGWREALAATAERVRSLRGPRRRLVLSLDGDPAQSASLYTFRRRPWPTRLVEVVLRSDAVEAIRLVPATRLHTTDPKLFEAEMCGL